MIPEFETNGYLPQGVHIATLAETIARFGSGSEQRVAQAQSLQWLVPLCRRAGIIRLVINGSFVTGAIEPNDVDCLLFAGPDYAADSPEARLVEAGLPFISAQLVYTEQDWRHFIDIIFGTDRQSVPKGVIEVQI